jgi:multiple sugar transport system permease protein
MIETVRREPVARVAWYGVLLLLGFVFLLPIASMISTAFSRPGDIFLTPPRLIPSPAVLDNIEAIWRDLPFLAFYRNSFQVSVLATAGQLFSASFTAFALAYLRFPGRGLLLAIVLGTMMVPYHVTMVPLFILMSKIGWLDSTLPLWVPSFFGGTVGAFSIFLLRQAFLAVPRELAEAATVDGANPLRLYWQIFLPLARPQLAVVAVFAFMTSWNDFIGPLIFINSPEKMTVTGGLSLFQSQFNVYWTLVMAGALFAMLPVLVLYILAQRYFVETVATAGLKG